MPPSRKTGKEAAEATVESMLLELEAIVSDLESSKMSLEDSVVAYQKGADIATACQARLSRIRERISVLDAQSQTLIDHPIDHFS